MIGSNSSLHIIALAAALNRPRDRANPLLKALARARRWRRQIESGEYASITELAKAERVNESYACRLLRLTLLSPAIVTDILDGRQNSGLTLKELMRPLSIRWDKQLAALNGGKIARTLNHN